MTTYLETEFDGLVDGILERGYGVADSFLAPAQVVALQQQLTARRAAGQFRAAGVGAGQTTVEKSIRGDDILWLDTATATAEETAFLAKIEAFMAYLNRTCYLGLAGHEFHYAHYPAGSFYKRHLDQFRTNAARKLSVIYYLNLAWQPAHGGQLAVYLPQPDGTEKTTLIDPIGGRLVCFDSGLLEHEVLPAHHERLSLTGWLRRAI